MKAKLFTDGGSRGNPGHSAAGIVIKILADDTQFEIGTYLGIGTNNEAEYKALIQGLETCISKGITQVESFLDSELVVKQLNGQYKVKDEKIKVFYTTIQKLLPKFASVTFTHIPRAKNSEADALVNKVLDSTLNA